MGLRISSYEKLIGCCNLRIQILLLGSQNKIFSVSNFDLPDIYKKNDLILNVQILNCVPCI